MEEPQDLDEIRKQKEAERRERSRKRREQMMLDVCDEIGVDSDSAEVQAEILHNIENINAKFVNNRTEGSDIDDFIERNKMNDCPKGRIGEKDECSKTKSNNVKEDIVLENHETEDLEYLDGNQIDGFKFLKKIEKDFAPEKIKKIKKEDKYNDLIEFILILALIIVGIIVIVEHMYRHSSERYEELRNMRNTL